jgi:predicted transcriptional regulator of viral defense system
MKTDRELMELAVRQGGVVRMEQALELGMKPSAVTWKVRTGSWHPVTRSTYRLISMSDPMSRTRAAIAALPAAVVSHETAATILSIPYVKRGLATVTVHSQTTHSFPDVVVHRSHDLTPNHFDTIDGLPVTTIPRTIVDLASRLHPRHFSVVLDEVIAARKSTIEDVEEVASEVMRRGKPGSAILRAAIEERWSLPASNASRLEILGLEVLAEAGLPEPETEFPVPWNPNWRFDAAYPEQRLAIEWDSRRWHTQVEAFRKDRTRDRLATLNKWRLVRFTWEDVTEHPGEVVRTIKTLLDSSIAQVPSV